MSSLGTCIKEFEAALFSVTEVTIEKPGENVGIFILFSNIQLKKSFLLLAH